MENKCVCCGKTIPEGRQICPKCERSSENRKDTKSALDFLLAFGIMTGAFADGGYTQNGDDTQCLHSQEG